MRRYRRKPANDDLWRRAVWAALAVLVLTLGACRGQQNPASRDRAPNGASAETGAGMKAYVDPKTGELLEKPAPGTPTMPGDVKVPRAATEKPAPGGGVMLDDDDEGSEDDDR